MGAVPRRRFLGWTGAAVATVAPGSLALAGCATGSAPAVVPRSARGPVVPLPVVRTDGSMTLDRALAARRSVRSFGPDQLSAEEVGQLLWSAQGVSHDGRLRTAPSAGAIYALELYAAGPAGTLRYVPEGHRAEQWATRDERADLASAGRSQQSLTEAALVVVVTVTPSRLAWKYGSRADRFADLEAGHATQNLLLQAVALGLGAVPVGSFDDGGVASVLDLPIGESARYLVAVGRQAG